MLSQAFARGIQEPPARSKSSNSFFPTNYPFPCLLNPENDEEQVPADDDDTAVKDQTADEDDVFEGLDDFDTEEIGSLRIASNTTRYTAAQPNQHRLVRGLSCQPGTDLR